jgi:hypothetical protein
VVLQYCPGLNCVKAVISHFMDLGMVKFAQNVVFQICETQKIYNTSNEIFHMTSVFNVFLLCVVCILGRVRPNAKCELSLVFC